jgi:hypothetical protein
VENSSLILIGFVVSKAGVGVIDNKIGAKEIETKTEIKTNSSKPLGSPISNKSCAATMPAI